MPSCIKTTYTHKDRHCKRLRSVNEIIIFKFYVKYTMLQRIFKDFVNVNKRVPKKTKNIKNICVVLY